MKSEGVTSASSNTESQHGFLAGQGLLAGCISFILLTILAFSVTLVPIRADNDVWWHVKSGKYIAENGLPEHDVFSYTAAEYPWHNHEWLTQVAMWHIWSIGDSSRLGGWRAVILAKAITLWLTYILILILAQRISKDWWIALIVAALALAVGRRSFYPRPPVVSDFLLAGMILLLTGVNEKWWSPRWLIALPFVVGLWTNLHGAWMAGVVILAAYVGQDVFLYFRDRFAPKFEFFEDTPGRLKARWWIALFGACLLATLFNPFGIELYKLPARVMSEPALTRGIGELRSPDFYFAWISEFTLLGLIFLLAVVRGYRPRLAEIGILLFFAHQGIQHVRHLVLFGLAMTPILARVLAGLRLELHEWLVEKRQYSGLLFLGMGVLIVAVTLRNPPEGQSYPERNLDYLRTEEGYKRGAYPSDVVDFIELVGFDGRMFNENYYAGYLIWRLAPEEHLVFSDSRFDIFGGDILRDENIISGGVEFTPDNESWRSRLDYWDVNWIITKGHTGLATEASAPDSGWALVAHWPELSSGTMRSGWQIWVRDNSKNADLIERARRMFSRQYGRSITDG